MRCINCISMACLLIGCLSLQLGCRSQALPVANPFMAPAVVPPPATRTPAPGTAAPYYPGDPLPGSSPTSAPAPIAPPAAYPPASTYPPASAPPSGWGAPPVSNVTPTPSGIQQAGANLALGPVESVQVPPDNGALRFAPTQQSAAITPTPQINQPVVPDTNASTLQFNQPQQYSQPQPEAAQVQFIQQPIPAAEQRPVFLREVSTDSALGREGTRRIGSDGFRPQGSSRTAREQQKVSRPVVEQAAEPLAVEPSEVADRFGFDPQYSWLRGKLERSSTTGQWQLRYIPLNASRDQFGGAVLIANPQVLGALNDGDYVAVHGRMELVQLGSGASVASFTVTVLQRQQNDLR